MNLSRYRCPTCHESRWRTSSVLWRCQASGHEYPCVSGIPRLYVESALGRQDKALRDGLYDGLLGTYRHGWMRLDADYTGLDLSETMLPQGQRFMSDTQIPIEFVLADAARPPFQSETFDIVLNYGALNGFTDPRLALEEMARVARTEGLVLFLDEQLYEGATAVERWYFEKVLSGHNLIHRCPVELMPAGLRDVQVRQVYPFYYLCTAYKA